MAVVALLVLAFFAGSVCSLPNAGRIVGGTEVNIEKYPSLVSVEYYSILSGSWSQSGAGNVLTSRYILSAAHCFDVANISYRRIRAGSSFRHFGGVVSYAEAAFNHPTYISGKDDSEGDVTVVRLAEPLTYNPVIKQVQLVVQGFVTPDYLPVYYAGWGATTPSSPMSPVLLEAQVYTINNKLCADRYQSLPVPLTVTDTMICAGVLDIGGKDACYGDTGGPLYYQEYLIGIISWGQGCGNGSFPVVNTAVASYTDWIISLAV